MNPAFLKSQLEFTPMTSKVETRLAESFQHHCPHCKWTLQVAAETRWTTFWIDMVAETKSGRRIGIECDGQKFHETIRDLCRDALILQAEHAHVIYRVPDFILNDGLVCLLTAFADLEPELVGSVGETAKKLLDAQCRNVGVKLALAPLKRLKRSRLQNVEVQRFLRWEEFNRDCRTFPALVNKYRLAGQHPAAGKSVSSN